jgi:mannose-1-phosphate guanylyltransferase/mannose-6-phosphate isomerase
LIDGANGAAPDADDPLLLVLPADHVVGDTAAFAAAVRAALDAAAAGYLVAFGIVPDRAETGYGYILTGRTEADGRWRVLEQFVEKPDRVTAEKYVASGRYLWNSGMFVFSARRYLAELERHAPSIAVACAEAAAEAATDEDFTRLGEAFSSSPSDSIDYAVMEKTDRAAVVPLDAAWNDVGSWPALHEILTKDHSGNVLRGDVMAEGCRECYISSSGRLVAAIGVAGHVIVETADAVLVMPHGSAQDVKRVVEALEAGGRSELRAHKDEV